MATETWVIGHKCSTPTGVYESITGNGRGRRWRRLEVLNAYRRLRIDHLNNRPSVFEVQL